jgi:hypothetical protein
VLADSDAEQMIRDVELFLANVAEADDYWHLRDLVRALVRDSRKT